MQLLDSAIDGALGLEKEADQKDAAWALLTFMRTGAMPSDLRQNAAAIMAAVLPALELSRARAEAPKNRKSGSKRSAKRDAGDEQTQSKPNDDEETKPATNAEQNREQTGNKPETNSETNAATNAKRRGRGIEDTYVSSPPYIPPHRRERVRTGREGRRLRVRRLRQGLPRRLQCRDREGRQVRRGFRMAQPAPDIRLGQDARGRQGRRPQEERPMGRRPAMVPVREAQHPLREQVRGIPEREGGDQR